jgi:hypothetical protein
MQPFDVCRGWIRRVTGGSQQMAGRPPGGCHLCPPNKHQRLRLLDHRRSLRCIARRPPLPNHDPSLQTIDELL